MADLNTMQTIDTETEEKRVKRLTEKSEKLYEENVEKYRKKLMSYRREIEEIIMVYKNTEELTKNDSVEMRNKLNNYYDNYDMIVQEYHNYLERKGTEQSLKELASEKVIHRTTAEKVVMILTEIEMSIKNVSVHIPSIVPSRTSTKSSSVKSQKSNILIAEQKAKLEAAKTKLEYEKKESALKETMASLYSKLSLLNNEKEVAIELTKLETLEEHLSENSHSEASVKSEIFGKTNHCRLSDVSGLPRRINLMTPKPAIPLREPMFDEISHLNPNAKPFAPQLSDLSVFLLKKDLMIQRLNTYNDKPEQFQLWKANFKNIMNELNASPIEELDLLLRYLGPRSKEQAQNIAQSNPNNKSKALQLIWERLFERFGAPELIEKSLKQRIDSFPRIKDNSELYGLADLCREIESTKNDERYTHLLSYFESSTGVRPILEKLPFHIQNKWMYRATNYKRANQVLYPPFSVFCTFLDEISTMFNDPGLSVSYVKSNERKPSQNQTFSVRSQNQTVNVRKTVTDASHVQCVEFMPNCCPVHNNAKSHTLNNCMTFLQRSVSERKRFLRDNNICFKCCNSNKHTFKSCTFTGPCDECGSQRHPTALHYFQAEQSTTCSDRQGKQPSKDYGRERPAVIPPVKPTFETKPPPQDQRPPSIVTGRCTNICGDGFVGKSCSKTLLVNIYPNNHPELSRSVYCIVDDQSNRTLCKSKMFDLFSNIPVGNENYELNSCSGSSVCNGRTIDNMTVSAIDGQFCTKLPTILECDSIPDSRLEIPTPDIVKYHQHLSDVPIPRLREDCEIVLLIGRDVAEVHHVFEQRISPEKPGAPFAQRLGLGWVVIGEVCLSSHRPPVRTMKTYVCESGRPSIFEPCSNKITVKHCHLDQVGANDIFVHTKNDDKPGLSLEDKEFLKLMDTQFHRDNSGHWTAPLPFRTPRIKLPNNRSEAYRRAKTFESSLKRDQLKLQHSLDFMENLLNKGYCERAPHLENEECWYLPLFGVYHQKKKDKIRIVFDSSSKFDGVSLNSVLMTGPDLTNSLTGILMRFRRDRIAVSGDIEQMFYQFRVDETHRNYLRFLWYEDNNFNKPLIEYRMCVHVFGNAPSPAVATYGLQQSAKNAAETYGEAMLDFVCNDFYVDDGLSSLHTEREAVSLLTNTKEALQEEGNLRFHKLVSNSTKVLENFSEEDLAKDIKSKDSPVHRSLGLSWRLDDDSFTFQLDRDEKPTYTKRTVLGIINSLYDPLGFLSPFTITGKLLLRDITDSVQDWDEPLPDYLHKKWLSWFQSLQDLQYLRIPRTYFPPSVKFGAEKELHVFCDASEKAISSVAYLKTVGNESTNVGYVFGKAKVAPKHGHTIPRLELCAAVLGVEIAEMICEELSISPENMTYHTDSKIVLGYLNNKTRRFYVYVENRVSRILKFSKSSQWKYVETDRNPTDESTRGLKPSELVHSKWLSGLPLLSLPESSEQYDLQNPNEDVEVRSSVTSMKTEVKFGINRFEKFSTWKRLVLAISTLLKFVRRFKKRHTSSSDNCQSQILPEQEIDAKTFIIKQVQKEIYHKEISCLKSDKKLPKQSNVLDLAPFIDKNEEILRVGGRLKSSQLPKGEKHPILIPGRSHTATLLVRHYHEKVHHQGRHITEGAVRTAGYWITGGKRLIANLIHSCVQCHKLRGSFSSQMMSNLPADRITPAPPFTYVGVDVFGPWNVITRRTRGGSSISKRWAVLFTCLSIRAIHIELVEEMSSSAFINALRRFTSLRGPVKIFRSDRGTNFVGATEDLGIEAVNVEDRKFANYLHESGSVWIFNPPHSSHFGGVWERMIGVTRRILDAILLENKNKHLTHEVLSTFMAEVCAIVNARPITPVSSDPENPFILSPSVLLTHKSANSPVSMFDHLDTKDMYKAQWKCVQVLAESFWKRWRLEYLSQLQPRRIWKNQSENIKLGDLVLLRDKSVHRNDWPIGIVKKVYPSDDGLVRKCSVEVMKDGNKTEYTRPIVELVKLLE